MADLDYNLHVFDGEGADVDEILNAANTLPFMSERKLVVVRRADKMNAAAHAALAEYAADPSPSACVALVGVKFDKRSKLYKAIDALGGTREAQPLKRGQYPAKVVEMFAARGKRVGVDAAQVLVEAVGRDLRRLAIEADKVCAYVGDAGTLTRDDIEQVMSLTAPTTIWEFLDSLGERDPREALRVLAALLDEGESLLGVWAMTLRHLRQLLVASSVLGRGDGSREIMREVGAAEWQARKLEGQARRFSEAELVGALRRAAGAEAEMKTSRDARLVFERWIVETCASA